MENTKNQFIELLSKSIRLDSNVNKYDKVDWDEIVELSKSHKVEGLIYWVLKESKLIDNIEEERVNELKRITFTTGVGQISNINKLSYIFEEFNKNNIPVIVLKGLVIRDLYPKPELRSMCDADILIHIEDLEKTKELLLKLGYIQYENDASHHSKFIHGSYPVIEVHWHIIKRDGFNGNIEEFEKMLWENTIKTKVGKSEVLSLGYEDLCLHLCMHMAAHLASGGFGLRQLTDLVLLIENKWDEINWESFRIKAMKYGFEKFCLIIIMLSKELFKIEEPVERYFTGRINEKNMNILKEEIFNSGVHGRRDITNSFGNQVAFNFNEKDKNSTIGALKRFMQFIFPSIDKISGKYSYIKGRKYLLPVAWIHHLYNGILNKDYKAMDKISFITKGAYVSIRKNKLLEWLEL